MHFIFIYMNQQKQPKNLSYPATKQICLVDAAFMTST